MCGGCPCEVELIELRERLFKAALEETNRSHGGALKKLAIIEAQELLSKKEKEE